MLSNHNLEMLLEKIFDNEETVNRIMATNDMHELYNLCLSIQDGYSFEEFSEFFDELVMTCGKALSELDEDDLSDVSGGAAIGLRKIAATTLASLSVISSVPSFGKAEEAPLSATSSVEVSLNDSDEIEPRRANPDDTKKQPQKEGVWRKFVNFLDRTTDKIWENRGGLLLLGAGLLAGGYALDSNAENIAKIFKDKNEYNKKYEQMKSSYDKAKEDEKKAFEAQSDAETKYNKMVDERTKGKKPEEVNPPSVAEDEANKELERAKEVRKAAEVRTQGAKDLLDGYEQKYGNNISLKRVSPTLAKVLGAPGAALGILSGLRWHIKSFGDFAKDINEIGKSTSGLMTSYLKIKNVMDNLDEKFSREDYDPEIAEEKLDISLNKMVRGQESAKKQIKKFFRTVNNARDRDSKGITSMKGAFVTVFNGPSGTGKTYTAGILTACLTNSRPYIVSAADINKRIEDASGSWGKPSVSSILFTSKRKSGTGSGDFDDNDYNLSSYINNHPKDGVVIIDEYDKLSTPGQKHPLDETFRNLIDKGEIEDSGIKINANGIVFILTTNETTASLQGKIKPQGEVVGIDEYGNEIYDRPKTDKFGTQTCVVHDPSFVQRLTGKICLFDALKPEDYTQIAKDVLGDDRNIKTEQQLVDIGGTSKVILSERISRGFDSVEISEDDYKMIGEFAASMPSAARTIVGAGNEAGSIAANLRDALNSKISDIIDNGGTVKNAKFKAVAKKENDASGSPTIDFTIKLVGYNDEPEESEPQ